MLADLIQPKLQERSPFNWVGKKKKELGQDLRPWEVPVKEGRFSHTGNSLH